MRTQGLHVHGAEPGVKGAFLVKKTTVSPEGINEAWEKNGWGKGIL